MALASREVPPAPLGRSGVPREAWSAWERPRERPQRVAMLREGEQEAGGKSGAGREAGANRGEEGAREWFSSPISAQRRIESQSGSVPGLVQVSAKRGDSRRGAAVLQCRVPVLWGLVPPFGSASFLSAGCCLSPCLLIANYTPDCSHIHAYVVQWSSLVVPTERSAA